VIRFVGAQHSTMTMLENKSCVLTGASGGIGEAIAQQLSRQGFTLILVGRHVEKLTKLAASLDSLRLHHVLEADLTSVEGRAKIASLVRQRADVSMLINNAGISHFAEFLSQEESAVEETLTTNLLAPMLLTKALMPYLDMSNDPTIINVGSSFGSIGYPCYTSYCASKFGLRGFTEALHRETASSGIRVKYFAPRATRTKMNSQSVSEMNMTLGNNTDEPDEVARQLSKFLKSTRSRHFVGWPEKLFARVNGVVPELVDRVLSKQVSVIRKFANLNTSHGDRT